jgi:hypothetical protein
MKNATFSKCLDGWFIEKEGIMGSLKILIA